MLRPTLMIAPFPHDSAFLVGACLCLGALSDPIPFTRNQ